MTMFDFREDSPGYRPYCFWLDPDDSYAPETDWELGSHKPKSVTFHMADFNGKNETVQAYRDNTDLLCKSKPRMQAYPSISKTVSIFKPPLMYGQGGTDADGNEV